MKAVQNAARFAYGCLVQLFVVRWTIHWVYSAPRPDITGLPELIAVSVACGGFYFWLFTRGILLKWTEYSRRSSYFRFIGRVSLRSVYAVALTWETVVILLSFYLGIFTSGYLHPTIWQRFGFVVLYLIDLQLWGAMAIAFGLPIAFVGGSLAGAFVIAARRRDSPRISLQQN